MNGLQADTVTLLTIDYVVIKLTQQREEVVERLDFFDDPEYCRVRMVLDTVRHLAVKVRCCCGQ